MGNAQPDPMDWWMRDLTWSEVPKDTFGSAAAIGDGYFEWAYDRYFREPGSARTVADTHRLWRRGAPDEPAQSPPSATDEAARSRMLEDHERALRLELHRRHWLRLDVDPQYTRPVPQERGDER